MASEPIQGQQGNGLQLIKSFFGTTTSLEALGINNEILQELVARKGSKEIRKPNSGMVLGAFFLRMKRVFSERYKVLSGGEKTRLPWPKR